MDLPTRAPILSSSDLKRSRSFILSMTLLFLFPFCALELAAQSAPSLPASAKELFSLLSPRPDFSRPSPLVLPPTPRVTLADRPDSSPLSTGISQNSQTSCRSERFHWQPGLLQGLFFLGIHQGMRMRQDKTRRELDGPFWTDYADSVRGLEWKWSDGGKFFTNYVAHAAQGSVTGFIWVHNDPRSKYLQIGRNPAYWISRMKAMAWTAAWSTQFEIGPISEASLGNVGQKPGTQAVGDFVTTPVLGTALLVEEDLVDRYIIGWVERKTTRRVWRAAARGLFNPNRSVANLLRFRAPWYRDARTIDNVSTIPN